MNSAHWVSEDNPIEWGMIVTPALPPKYDAVIHSYANRFEAYKLVDPNKIPERNTRFGYASKRPSGFFSDARMLYPDGFGAELLFPAHYEWTELAPELLGGRLKVGVLEKLKPDLDKAERDGKEHASKRETTTSAALTEVQAKWLEDYAGAERLYRLFIAELMGVKEPSNLSESLLSQIESLSTLQIRPKDEFIFNMIGECPPEPEQVQLAPMPKEYENDFWAYMDNANMAGMSINRGAA